MVVYCPGCHEFQITDRGVYDSPLFRCPVCGREFLEQKITEPALLQKITEPEQADRGPNIGFASLALFAAMVTLFRGLHDPEVWGEVLFYLLLGGILALFSLPGWLISKRRARRTAESRIILLQSLLEASRLRLADEAYQQNLLAASGHDPELLQQLKNYNAKTGLRFDLTAVQQSGEGARTE